MDESNQMLLTRISTGMDSLLEKITEVESRSIPWSIRIQQGTTSQEYVISPQNTEVSSQNESNQLSRPAAITPTVITAPTISAEPAIQENIQNLPPVPAYKMSRHSKTVNQLWIEWKYGIGNNPSIQRLENDYGIAWRSSAAETKYFNRRRIIINKIESLIESGMSEREAIETVERMRMEMRNKSLAELQDAIRPPVRKQVVQNRE